MEHLINGNDSYLKRRIGIMQGRLSPRPATRLQAFPTDTWEDEFERAAQLGLDGIEWIFEAENAELNPIRSSAGRKRIRDVIKKTGVQVISVCGDYFMCHRLSEPGATGEDASRALSTLISQAESIGAKRILLPWLEEASLDTPSKVELALRNLRATLPAAERYGISLGLEMDIPGKQYQKIVEGAEHKLVKAYYDTGNSTAQGFDVAQDVLPLRAHLGAVHIKDRLRGGESKLLGQGDTNFTGLFQQLHAWNFSGDLVLQHYFESPQRDAELALKRIRSFWPRQEAA